MKEIVRTKVIVNPQAGAGTAGRAWPRIEQELKTTIWQFDTEFTMRPQHAMELARKALQAGFERIISVGGDGTHNEIVNGFFEQGKAINPRAGLGIISVGTGGDFVRTIGYNGDIPQKVLAFRHGRTRPLDIGCAEFQNYYGRLETRYFLNVVDFGIGGEVVDRVNRGSKAMGGRLSFLLGTVSALLSYQAKPVRLVVDDRVYQEEPIFAVVISNGKYFGGGMQVAPNAETSDGCFDVIVITELSRLNILFALPRIYRGKHIDRKGVTVLQARKVEAYSSERVMIDLDGEQPGILPAVFRILPAALTLYCD